MTNNDIFRRIRYIIDFDDLKMVELFQLANHKVKRFEVCNWLKKEGDEDFQELTDRNLAIFLDGLIIKKRGRKEGPLPVPEDHLDNNSILKKLKIAFNLKTEAVLEIFELVNRTISAHELSAFFRKPSQRQYRPCNGQYLRNFLEGLRIKYRNE